MFAAKERHPWLLSKNWFVQHAVVLSNVCVLTVKRFDTVHQPDRLKKWL